MSQPSHIIMLFAALFMQQQIYAATGLSRLTESEADAIILAEQQAKMAKEAALIEKLQSMPASSEASYVEANGATRIYRNVAAPVRSVAARSGQVATSASATKTTPKQPADFKTYAAKANETLMLSATVYDQSITRVSWMFEGESYTAYTNANFNYLRGVSHFETDVKSYFTLMGIGDVTTEAESTGTYDPLPVLPAFKKNRSEYYLLESSVAAAPTSSEAFEAVLDYYDTHLPELKVAHQRREALAAAHKRYVEAHPPQPETLIFNFFEPEGPVK